MNGKSALGVLLVAVGGIAILKFIGINFGAILGLLLPFILIGFGILGWVNGKKIIGGVLAAIGGLMLLGKLGGILMLLLAIGAIAWGVSMVKKSRHGY
ncbi:LiaF transmembrane domain-containing protein [Paenibacillus sp. 2TAB19]|uniref:LiaF transmembrane domain-containing protein n=1 Tax=Paenibacillus sp. 2TAB19 TaxID=3233003 RepID=UPI003F9E5356